ncbi:hypothetical transporter [Cutibacterium acnes JCM 18918]|nr:hypothetical transporter [Cutibacterium acnes JCM 18918]
MGRVAYLNQLDWWGLIVLGGAGPVVFELFGRDHLPKDERSVPDCG